MPYFHWPSGGTWLCTWKLAGLPCNLYWKFFGLIFPWSHTWWYAFLGGFLKFGKKYFLGKKSSRIGFQWFHNWSLFWPKNRRKIRPGFLGLRKNDFIFDWEYWTEFTPQKTLVKWRVFSRKILNFFQLNLLGKFQNFTHNFTHNFIHNFTQNFG